MKLQPPSITLEDQIKIRNLYYLIQNGRKGM